MYSFVESLGQKCIRKDVAGEPTLFIPCDPANTDYQAYLAWVAEGNTAEEWVPQVTEGA